MYTDEMGKQKVLPGFGRLRYVCEGMGAREGSHFKTPWTRGLRTKQY